MAHDYAKRSRTRKTQPPPKRFSLGSYIAGVISGAGLLLLGAYGPELLQDSQTQTHPQAQAQTEAQTNTVPVITDQAQDIGDADLEFVFRDMLGSDTVDPDLSAYEADVLSQQPKDPNLPMQILLQSGSFQIQADAESRRGTLLLMDLPANIVEAQIDNRIWYRVIVGPYSERGEAQRVVMRLKDSAISSIWMERPLSLPQT